MRFEGLDLNLPVARGALLTFDRQNQFRVYFPA